MEVTAVPALRDKLLALARERVEESGPEALRARSLTAQADTSTQSLYTLFGGMPGLIDALVADFFAKGWTYAEWALAHPHLYRLMYGLSGGELRHHAGLEVALATLAAN